MENRKMVPCNKCGHKTVLAIGYLSELSPDQEPYQSDVVEPCDSVGETIYEEVSVGIHYCEQCQKISDIWIESPQINEELEETEPQPITKEGT